VEYLTADLSSRASIDKMVAEFQSRHPALHILLNNAGMAPRHRSLSPDGIEMTFAVNHLAYYLMSQLLLDSLKAGAPSRIVNVSSEAHRSGVLDFGNLQAEKKFSTWGVYSLSKLCNLLFTLELAQRLKGTGITANALHPGFVSTAIFRQAPGFVKLFVRGFAMNPQKGAENSIFVASSPDVEGISGKYFVKKKEALPASKALDSGAAKRLWETSERLTQAGS
jgi:NAD(P)-dependent dehydrogenase (short-subunit alcohol dehydrogenase family)